MPRAAKKETKEEVSEKQIVTSALDDERRLFYVALTRAKESVTITYAREDETHRETLPSEFIGEIKPELKNEIDVSVWEEKFKNDRAFQFVPVQSVETTPASEKEFVNELFEKQGLSPTALNNYLECPWKYFYQNLLRIPSAQNKHQCYGTAIHGALKDFFDAMKREPMDAEKAKAYLLAAFERWINNVSLAPGDYEESKAKGERALNAWFDSCNDISDINIRTQTEFRINGVELGQGNDNAVRLTGVLDKIEWNDDETVTVVDYKTGKPKSRNELLGKTKSADGNYYRQLTFYKLLLTHFKDGQYVMTCGVIDFIEPDESGKCHKESFEITDDDVAALTDTILRVSNEIKTLAFWDKHCNDKDCEYCAMRKLVEG